jgi:TonB family protein
MSHFVDAVASYAVNALWEVPLVAGAGWVVSCSMMRLGARAQHRMWVLTLWLAVLAPAMPLLRGVFALRAAGTGSGSVSIAFAAAQGRVVGAKGIAVLPSWMVLSVAMIYLSALLFFAARLGWSMYWTAGLLREAQPLSLEAGGEEVWSRCLRAFGLEGVRLLSSRRVDGPVTMRWRRAVLLVPEGFAERCEPHELLAALAHECAHVERGDFQKNLIYEVVSLLIAFHPVTRMMKSRVAETREMVCDEIAVESVMDSRMYAQSLLRLATMISVVSRAVPSNAIGIFDANILEKRIMTIRTKKQRVSARYGLIIPGALLLFSVAVGEAVARGVVVEPDTHTQTGDAAKPYGEVYSLGKDVSAPKVISSVPPEFPKSAMKNKKDTFEGTVLVGMVVDKQGVPRDVHVVRSLRPDFDAKSVEAVEQYRFVPAMKAGEPVAVALKVEVNFKRF